MSEEIDREMRKIIERKFIENSAQRENSETQNPKRTGSKAPSGLVNVRLSFCNCNQSNFLSGKET